MIIPSILRLKEHEALSKVTLNGTVIDLGGTRQAEYHSFFKGKFEIVTVNLDETAHPDFFHDLEKPLTIQKEAYDHALLINTLEHIFNYRQLLQEAARVIRKNGLVVIAVPFLFPIHPSPNDYWRFTNETLEKECALAGLRVESLTPLGTGVFSARHLFIARLMPGPIRFILHYTVRYVVVALDWLFARVAKALGKKYTTSEYPLGYVVVARKV